LGHSPAHRRHRHRRRRRRRRPPHRTCEPEEHEQHHAVREQMGYLPSNFIRVVSWTKSGERLEPVVIQTYPLDGGSSRRQRKTADGGNKNVVATPFPTLYWLCHGKIHRAVGELERLGYGKNGSIVLTQNEEHLLLECHRQYARDRWRSLSEEDRTQLPEQIIPMLKESGIAGINVMAMTIQDNGLPSFKCLHAHYAHYRANGTNPVGAHVERLLRSHFPDLEL
jgi:hypothetical protein